MKLITGDKLPENLKREVLRTFTYRLTTENGYPQDNPCGAKVAPISDEQWLAEHAFYVTNAGSLSRKHSHCEPYYMAEENHHE